MAFAIFKSVSSNAFIDLKLSINIPPKYSPSTMRGASIVACMRGVPMSFKNVFDSFVYFVLLYMCWMIYADVFFPISTSSSFNFIPSSFLSNPSTALYE